MSENFLLDSNDYDRIIENNDFNFQATIDESQEETDSEETDSEEEVEQINRNRTNPGKLGGNLYENNKFPGNYIDTRNELFTPEIIKKRILVSTYQLNQNVEFNSSDYVFNLYSSNGQGFGNFNRTGGLGLFRNVIGFKLLDCIIENETFTINESNNELYYIIHDKISKESIAKLDNKIKKNKLSQTIFEEPEISDNTNFYIIKLINGNYNLDNISDCIPRDTASIAIGNMTGKDISDLSRLGNNDIYESNPNRKRVEYNNMVDIDIFYDNIENRIVIRSPIRILPYWEYSIKTRGLAKTLGFYNNIDQLRTIDILQSDNNIYTKFKPIKKDNESESISNNESISINENISNNNSCTCPKNDGTDDLNNLFVKVIRNTQIIPGLPCLIRLLGNSINIIFKKQIDNVNDEISNYNLKLKELSLLCGADNIPSQKTKVNLSSILFESTASIPTNNTLRINANICRDDLFNIEISDRIFDIKIGEWKNYDPNKTRFIQPSDMDSKSESESDDDSIPIIDYSFVIPRCYYMNSICRYIQGPVHLQLLDSKVNYIYDVGSKDDGISCNNANLLQWTNGPQIVPTPLIPKNNYRCGIIADQIPHLKNSYIDLVVDEIPDIATIGNSIGYNIIERITSDNTKFGNLIHYDTSKAIEPSHNYFYPIILDKLSIKLYGDNGFILDNSGSNNSFEFEITMINSNNSM